MKAPVQLLAGGPGNDPRRMTDLLAEALACADARGDTVACLGSANGDDPGFFRRISSLLQAAGAAETILAPTARGSADAPRARDVLGRARAVFVSGGDVEAGMEVVRAIGLEADLAVLARQGIPFIGVSAGSIMLGQRWIAWRDPDDDASAHVFDCLGIAPLVCDAHAEAEDWPELRALLVRLPAGACGYGITAGALLRADAAGRVAARGGDVHVLSRGAEGAIVRTLLRPRRLTG